MASWHQVQFLNPRGETARRLMELRSRRSELQMMHREAQLATQNASRECERARAAADAAEGRAFALGSSDENLSALRGQATKATKAQAAAVEHEAKMATAARVIDNEMTATAMEGIEELLGELQENHDLMRERADEAAQQLGAAASAMRAIYAASMALANATDASLNRNIREPVTAEEILVTGVAPPLFNVRVGDREADPPVARFEADDDVLLELGERRPNEAGARFVERAAEGWT